jgi:hypothetical protein
MIQNGHPANYTSLTDVTHETVPPEPHGLMRHVDAPLVQQVLDIPK